MNQCSKIRTLYWYLFASLAIAAAGCHAPHPIEPVGLNEYLMEVSDEIVRAREEYDALQRSSDETVAYVSPIGMRPHIKRGTSVVDLIMVIPISSEHSISSIVHTAGVSTYAVMRQMPDEPYNSIEIANAEISEISYERSFVPTGPVPPLRYSPKDFMRSSQVDQVGYILVPVGVAFSMPSPAPEEVLLRINRDVGDEVNSKLKALYRIGDEQPVDDKLEEWRVIVDAEWRNVRVRNFDVRRSLRHLRSSNQ